MKEILKLVHENRFTCVMIAFLVLFYSFIFAFNEHQKHHASEEHKETETTERLTSEAMARKETAFRANLQSHPRLMIAFSLLFTFLLLAGLSLNLYLLVRRLQGFPVMQRGTALSPAPWGVADVVQVLVLLFFLEAAIVSGELFTALLMGKESLNKDFMLMVNSLVRDVLVAGFVIGLVLNKFKGKLSDIGLSTNRFFQNIKSGLITYLAIIPSFILLLVALGLVSKLFSYEPPPQPVVEIYLNESKNHHLVFFTFFVALVGPLIEEIFFRGFAYQAFRARFGVTMGMVFSAFIFAALHLNLVAFLPIFFLGLVLCYLYEKTGSLVAPMTVHMSHNFLMVCFTLFYKSFSGT